MENRRGEKRAISAVVGGPVGKKPLKCMPLKSLYKAANPFPLV
jgi:hypothetical protein